MTDREHVYSYLNVLRNSCVTNMFGATPYIMKEFHVGRKEASKLLADWMRQFKG